jgi:release factor glutamine methyltransferase
VDKVKKLMKVLEALQWANDKLGSMLDAEVLLSAVLRVTKSWLFTHLDQTLSEPQSEGFRSAVKRRMTGEPVAYIVGRKAFYKRDFNVNRFVLIPRPATETLVELAIEIAKSSRADETIVGDIGTGSGTIAVTMAAETRLPTIASDISPEALSVARANAVAHSVDDILDFRQGDLAEPILSLFDSLRFMNATPFSHLVLAANLPYLPDNRRDELQPDVRDFEPTSALFGGGDGLELYWRLVRQLSRARHVLPKRTTILWEIDPTQTAAIQTLITHDFPHAHPEIKKDLEGFDRVVITEI